MKHIRNTSAFTMVEMLVVIGIIGILAGLLLPAVTMVKNRGRIAATTVKIQAVITGIQQSSAERNLVSVMAGKISGFKAPVKTAYPSPAPAPDAVTLAHPPGEKFRTITGWGTESVNLKDFVATSTLEFLYYGGMFNESPDYANLPSDGKAPAASGDAFDTDRSPQRPWNDSWGSPLIVAYAFWDTGAAGTTQHNRARGVSFAVGSTGSKMAGTGLPSSSTRLEAAWRQIMEACDPGSKNNLSDDNNKWKVTDSVNAWTEPPFMGAKTGKSKQTGTTCVLHAPVEIP